MLYLETKWKEDWELEKPKQGWWSLSESSVKLQRMEDEFYGDPKTTPALEAAVLALDKHINKQKRTNNMTQLQTQSQNVSLEERFNYSPEQMQYIKTKVCQHATDAELIQFFYRCSVLKLDPLMPGQIYFLKFKKRNPRPGEDAYSPGSIVIGVDGFRALASRTGQLSGIKRGVIRGHKGEAIGGWADVYRKDWDHPAHLEVSLKEYADEYKDTWRDMPESMIQKVAEVAALRMAFPEALGGIYAQEEMDQARRKEREVQSSVQDSKPAAAQVVKPAQKPIEDQRPPHQKLVTRDQISRLFAIAKEKAIYNKDELKHWIINTFEFPETFSLTQITQQEYQDICKQLETVIVEKPAADSFENFQTPQNSQIREPGADEDQDPKPLPAAGKNPSELPWTKHLPKEDPRMVK